MSNSKNMFLIHAVLRSTSKGKNWIEITLFMLLFIHALI